MAHFNQAGGYFLTGFPAAGSNWREFVIDNQYAHSYIAGATAKRIFAGISGLEEGIN
jgi:hypothetical protein